MLHPIFSVLVSRPELLVEHFSGYALLLRDEASTTGRLLAKRAVAWGIAAGAAFLFVVFAGVAIMLGGVAGVFHWTLLAVPGVMLLAAIVAFMRARKPLPQQTFAELRAQLDADAQALRAVGARP